MDEFKKVLFKNSIGFKTTVSLENDLKIIKRLNNLVAKDNRAVDSDKYSLEIINIFVMLGNRFTLTKSLKDIIVSKFIDSDNIEKFNILYNDYSNNR